MNTAIRRLTSLGWAPSCVAAGFFGGGEWRKEKEAHFRARKTKLPAMQATKRIPPLIVGSRSSPNHFSTGWHPLAKNDIGLN